MIDLNHARREFARYLEAYNPADPKVKLKIIHTYGVVRCAREITRRMGLSKEDADLAELIALLHDIGRFEQVTRFNSFEPTVMDHATYGVQLLFGETDPNKPAGLIRRFVQEDTWDPIIRESIAHHSDYELPDLGDERIMLHARLIRDADKLDNCRVKLEEPIRVLLNTEAEEVGSQGITPIIWQTCLDCKAILSADRITKMDYWISYLAYFYDINYPATYSIIREEKYTDRIIDRIPYTNPDTIIKMQELRIMLNNWIGEHADADTDDKAETL